MIPHPWLTAQHFARLALVFGALALADCTSLASRSVSETSSSTAGQFTIFVVKRKWHTDIGFPVTDLRAPLSALAPRPAGTRYVLFGFGDRHYLMDKGSMHSLMGAIWPGPGLILVTNLKVTPEEAFGAANALRLTLSQNEERSLEKFVWDTLATQADSAAMRAPGPYEGSYYYDSVPGYSALHTCNTWTAEGLHAAGLPVSSVGVVFSGQVWRRVRALSDVR